ncbi:hypothetical protein K0M31_014741 [Melipona bicolor]|uniref:Uncharacterized protein n=1 Tax=Melipona bicolor TaxID=60889 RepID=A0AA40FGR9_9HYME|nr:hypothetical protein K0M31_014741 [Melipona bicolor]
MCAVRGTACRRRRLQEADRDRETDPARRPGDAVSTAAPPLVEFRMRPRTRRREEKRKKRRSAEGNEIGQIRIRIQGAFGVSPPPATAQDLRIRVRSPAECRMCRGVREQIIDAVSHGAALANKAAKLCGA